MKYPSPLFIGNELQSVKQNYDTAINILPGLQFRQKDTIKMIEFYSNSKYLNGQKDELNREKPFYNIVNSICDVENAAKDINTRDIIITSDDGNHYTESFLMNKDVYEWMKEVNFAKTLNDIRDLHTRYGSVLAKKCYYRDEDGNQQLEIQMPEWKNLITDQVNIMGGTIVEVHYMNARELFDKKDVWDNVDDVIDKLTDGNSGYNKRAKIYEVRGWFPKSFIKQLDGGRVTAADKKSFSYQLYYLAGEVMQNNNPQTVDDTNFAGNLVPLYYEDNTEQVYKYLARKPKVGRSFGVGVVEEGEEPQVWTNDVVLKQFRAMEYTTKVIGQTASRKLKGRNVLNEVDDGQILEHEDGKPVTALQLLPAGGLTQYGVLINQWFTQFERTTSAYSALRGESPTSRTSAKLQSAVMAQAGSVMKSLQQDIGIFLTEIFEDWVMPFLAKKLNAQHILAHDFSIDELAQIDHNFSLHTANEMAKNMMLSGQLVDLQQYNEFMKVADQHIKKTKGTRFLDLPKGYYKAVRPKLTINITGEQGDKRAITDTLMGIMKLYATNPRLITDPVLTQLFLKIVELSGTGISPINLISAIQQQAAAIQKQGPASKVSESINFKDLPPEGQVQMAGQAGIKLTPPAQQGQPGQADQGGAPAPAATA